MTSLNRDLSLLLIATFLYRATSNTLQTNIPLFAKYDLDATNFVVSSMVTIITAVGLIVVVVAGFHSARLRTMVTIGLVSVTVYMAAMPFVASVPLLVFLSALNSLGSTPLQPLLLSAVALVSKGKDQSKNIALFSAVLGVSVIVGPLLQAGILSIVSSNLSLAIAAFAPLPALALIAFSLAGVKEQATVQRNWHSGFLKNRGFLAGMVSNIIYSFPFVALTAFGGILARTRFDLSFSDIQLLFTAFFVVSLATRLLLSRKNYSKHGVILTTVLTTMVGLLLLFAASSTPVFVIAFTLLGYPHGAAYPAASSMIAESVTHEEIAAANTVAFVVWGIVSVVGLPMVGMVAELFGVQVSFLALLLPVAATTIVYFWLQGTAKASELALIGEDDHDRIGP